MQNCLFIRNVSFIAPSKTVALIYDTYITVYVILLLFYFFIVKKKHYIFSVF